MACSLKFPDGEGPCRCRTGSLHGPSLHICRLTNLRLYAYLPAYAGGLSAYLLFLIVKCVWLDRRTTSMIVPSRASMIPTTLSPNLTFSGSPTMEYAMSRSSSMVLNGRSTPFIASIGSCLLGLMAMPQSVITTSMLSPGWLQW